MVVKLTPPVAERSAGVQLTACRARAAFEGVRETGSVATVGDGGVF